MNTANVLAFPANGKPKRTRKNEKPIKENVVNLSNGQNIAPNQTDDSALRGLFSVEIKGDRLKKHQLFDGDVLFANGSLPVRDSDFALVQTLVDGKRRVFKVYFDGNSVILDGSKVSIVQRNEVILLGRVVSLQRTL